MKKSSILLLFTLFISQYSYANDSKYEAVELYSQDELNTLIYENKHLQQIEADECQLVEDIEAHALKIKEPAYVYLWGDMLAWGICVERNARLGMYYIKASAKQGLLPALDQLGRYYENGTLVVQNKEHAIIYYREAAMQGFLKAQLNYVRMLIEGYGSPYDYEDAYRALFLTIIDDKKLKQRVNLLLSQLAEKMPEPAIERASREDML